jgi:hypothetical protein
METPTDSSSPESWEYARGYAGVFGTIPSSFTSVIRTLMNEHSAGLAQTAGNSKYFVVRLLKSPSLAAPFYFAAEIFNPAILEKEGPTSADQLIKGFTPFEIASVLGLVYLVRRGQGLCDPNELKNIFDPMIPKTNIAFAIGRTIPAIGVGTALLEATMIPIAVAAFAKHDAKGFKEYRRDVQKQFSGSWNVDLEVSRWGCNHLQIGSVLLQSLGFGITRANAFVNAVSHKSDLGTLEEINLCRDFRMAAVWREAIATTYSAPTIPLPPKYYPTKASQDAAVATIKAVQEDSEASRWLLKGKNDLPPVQLSSPKGPAGLASSTPNPSPESTDSSSADIDALAREMEQLGAESSE